MSEKLAENNINRTIEITFCISNSENKFLNHILKNHDVLSKHLDKIAKGERRTNTFIITYLSAYTETKFIKDKLIVPFINPSAEKIFKEPSIIFKFLFTDVIKLEKLIFFP